MIPPCTLMHASFISTAHVCSVTENSMLVFSTSCLQVLWKNTGNRMNATNNHNTAQYGYSTWEYEYKVTALQLWSFWRLGHWGVLVPQCTVRFRKTRGCGRNQLVTVSWCDSSHTADRELCDPPGDEANKNREFSSQCHSNLLELVCFGLSFRLSWICSVWQGEATYLLNLVRPYRVRGGETDRTEEGGECNCGTVGSGTVRRW